MLTLLIICAAVMLPFVALMGFLWVVHCRERGIEDTEVERSEKVRRSGGKFGYNKSVDATIPEDMQHLLDQIK